MALKHYAGGGLRESSTVWNCPTCGAENTGKLEAGCAVCGAGGDAKKVADAKAPFHAGRNESGERLAFEDWVARRKGSANISAWEAWQAGVQWAADLHLPAPTTAAAEEIPPVSTGGFRMALIDPSARGTHPFSIAVDSRTQATVVAALAFYRDNQLAYGALPGQLSADEVDGLIAQLTPPEDKEIPF